MRRVEGRVWCGGGTISILPPPHPISADVNVFVQKYFDDVRFTGSHPAFSFFFVFFKDSLAVFKARLDIFNKRLVEASSYLKRG